jgi:energy-coupling factor transporter transmembrane protein EcfT
MGVMSDSQGLEVAMPKARASRGRPFKAGVPRRRTTLSLPVPLAQFCFDKADELGMPISDVFALYACLGSGLPVPDYITKALEAQGRGEAQAPLLEAS